MIWPWSSYPRARDSAVQRIWNQRKYVFMQPHTWFEFNLGKLLLMTTQTASPCVYLILSFSRLSSTTAKYVWNADIIFCTFDTARAFWKLTNRPKSICYSKTRNDARLSTITSKKYLSHPNPKTELANRRFARKKAISHSANVWLTPARTVRISPKIGFTFQRYWLLHSLTFKTPQFNFAAKWNDSLRII